MSWQLLPAGVLRSWEGKPAFCQSAGGTCPAPVTEGQSQPGLLPAGVSPKSLFLAQPWGLRSAEQAEFTLTASMGSASSHLGPPSSLFSILATGDRDMGQVLPANPR